MQWRIAINIEELINGFDGALYVGQMLCVLRARETLAPSRNILASSPLDGSEKSCSSLAHRCPSKPILSHDLNKNVVQQFHLP
jgi:hypothetical protein